MFTKGILLAIFVATVDQTFVDPVVGPLVGGGGLAPFPGGPFPPALGIVPPIGEVPRRAPTPLASAQPEGGLSPPPDQRPSPGQNPIQNQPVWTGPPASPPKQQEQDRTRSEAPRRTGTPEALVRPGDGPATTTVGRPSPVPRPIEEPSVRTGPAKNYPKQEQDRPVETDRQQAVGGGLAPSGGGPLQSAVGIVPMGGEVPRRTGTPEELVRPGNGPAPPTEGRPSPVPRPIEDPSVRTGPAKTSAKQEQDRLVETDRQQAVGGGLAPSGGGPLQSAVGIAPMGGDFPRRTGTPEELVRPGDGPAPPIEGRPSPVPRPIEDPSVRTGSPNPSTEQEQDRPGSEAPRRTGTPEALVRPGAGPAPPTEGRPSPVPRPREDPSVRAGPEKTSPKQEQDRLVKTDRQQAVGGGLAPSGGGSLQSVVGIAPMGGDVPRRTGTPEKLVRPGDGPAPPTEGRPSPVPRPIEDPSVRTGPPKTSTEQEQDRPGSEAPRRTGTPEALVRPGAGTAPPTEGRSSPVPRPREDPSVWTGPAKTTPKQEQDRPVETDRQQAVGGGPAPSGGGSLQSAVGIAPMGGDTGTPEKLVRPGDGPAPPTEGRPSPVPRPIEDPSVRTGPPKTSTVQEQDRPGSEAPRRTGTPEALVRPGAGPAAPSEGRPSPVPRPREDPSVWTGPAKTTPKQEQDRPVETDRQQAVGGGPAPSGGGSLQSAVGIVPMGGEGPRRTGTPEELVRPGDGPAQPTEGRPSPVPRPIEDPSVRTGPPKTSTEQEQDRPGSEAPRRTGTPEALVRPGAGPAPSTEGRPSPVPRPREDPSVWTGPAKTSPKQEQDRSVETVRPQTVRGSPEPSTVGVLPPDGERRTGTPPAFGRPGDGSVPLTEERLFPGPRPIQHPPVWTGSPKTSSKQQEQYRPIQHPPVWTGLPRTSPTRQQENEAGPPAEGATPPRVGLPTPSPRPIQHPPVYTGPRKTPRKQQQRQQEPVREQEVEEPRRGRRPNLQKSSNPLPVTTSPTTVPTNPTEGATPPRVGRPTPSPRPIQHPPVWTGPRKTPRKQQQRQQEPVREQEVEEPRRGRRPNLQKSSNPLPVTTPPTTVPTNPTRIPFSTKEFAVTTPPTTVPIDPPRSQPCSIAAVCGSDGYTYFSECFLPGGVWKECDGSCPCPVQNPQPSHPSVSACTCPKIYNPVCGVDGNTYDNDCWRRCNYVAKDCEGHCPCDRPSPIIEPVSCSCKNKEYNPVCSVFGNAYDNECELRCSGESKQCDNECPCTQEKSVTHSECVCNPFETDPVCTTDGETIWNGCEAMCAGKEIACTSTCPC